MVVLWWRCGVFAVVVVLRVEVRCGGSLQVVSHTVGLDCLDARRTQVGRSQ